MAITKILSAVIFSIIAFSVNGAKVERKWIGPAQKKDWPATNPAPVFVRGFTLAAAPKSAKVAIAAAGWFELKVNGRKIGKNVLEPVTCQPDKRISEVTHDVTEYLKVGKNEIEILVGNGWFGVDVPVEVWGFATAAWHKDVPPSVNAELIVNNERHLATDTDWQVYDSPIVFSALRCGEYYDARREDTRINLRPAVLLNKLPTAVISPEDAVPCREAAAHEPVKAYAAPQGGTIYDFGHNIAGWCELEVVGEAGAKVTVFYDEMITSNLRLLGSNNGFNFGPRPSQQDEYTLKGGALEKWHPRFTYHGFRYARVTVDGKAEIKAIRSREVHSAFASAGSLQVSDKNFAHLQAAALRSYTANFVGIPTDCPHREKNGWTGDAHLACETGLWNFDSKDGYVHFIRMMIDTQRPDGQVPCIIPCTEKFGYRWGSGPAWDAILYVVPREIYRFYGDDSLAREAYPAMKRYLDYIMAKAQKDGLVKVGLGDWCAPGKTVEMGFVCSAWVYYFHCEVARWARHFGENDYAEQIEEKAADFRNKFNAKYYKGNGHYANDELTALGCVLYFKGLCADGDERKVAEVLVKRVRELKWKCDFGIMGAKWVPRALAEYGYASDAWQFFTRENEEAGYMRMIKSGEDTLWETFDGNASHNHIMFGDFSAWAYEYVAGIRIVEPGFRKVSLKPNYVEGLESIEARYRTPFGEITAGWKRGADDKPVFKYSLPEGIELVK